jgi:hypothetical protein
MRRCGNCGRQLSAAERLEIQQRVATGETFAEVAAAVGCCTKSIQRLRIETVGMKRRFGLHGIVVAESPHTYQRAHPPLDLK